MTTNWAKFNKDQSWNIYVMWIELKKKNPPQAELDSEIYERYSKQFQARSWQKSNCCQKATYSLHVVVGLKHVRFTKAPLKISVQTNFGIKPAWCTTSTPTLIDNLLDYIYEI